MIIFCRLRGVKIQLWPFPWQPNLVYLVSRMKSKNESRALCAPRQLLTKLSVWPTSRETYAELDRSNQLGRNLPRSLPGTSLPWHSDDKTHTQRHQIILEIFNHDKINFTCQVPIFDTRRPKGRWRTKHNLKASPRNSRRFPKSAARAARGKADEKRQT